MSDLVSIIIPVYNLEDYIEHCLKSIVNQTYKNLEIICIDDGSSDSSGKKIRDFAEKDNRIIYVKKDNGGVSSARNMGIDMCSGEFVMFVDGDDFLHSQTVDVLSKVIKKSKCDFVCADFFSTDELNIKYTEIIDYSFSELELADFFNKISDIVCRSACGKLFTKEAVQSSCFPEGVTNGEDFCFLVKVLDQFSRVSYLDQKLYFYYNRIGSASKSIFKISAITMVDGLSDLCEFLNDESSKFLLAQSLCMLFKSILTNKTLCIGTEYQKEVLIKCKKIGNKWLGTFLFSRHVDIKTKLMILVFYHSRHLYELARLITDPTMKDFYKNRRKHNG